MVCDATGLLCELQITNSNHSTWYIHHIELCCVVKLSYVRVHMYIHVLCA